MFKYILLLLALACVSRATYASCVADSDYIDCVADCYDVGDACEISSCYMACTGEYCDEYCEAIGCPPGNTDDSCLITCSSGDYHTCADASALFVGLLALAF